MLLAREQRIGAIILFGIALAAWLAVAIWQSPEPMEEPTTNGQPPKTKHYRTWEQRKDSMRQVDSLRYAQWSAEREQRYDSFRLADKQRRAEWKTERQAYWDSCRLADSLWKDSVGIIYARHIKKDTVLDLNHCDTTELQYIRGIGTYTAQRIVYYRTQLGGYYSPLQLTDEPFANLHLDTLLHHFVADSADVEPIDVNRCGINRLARHPYLRYEQAKALYELRRKSIRLHSIDELTAFPEFSPFDLSRLRYYLRFED